MPARQANQPASTGSASRRRLARVLCACLGAALLAQALYLMGQRVFHLGVMLPAALALGLLSLGLGWDAVHGWSGRTPWRRRLWRWVWAAFWLWIASVVMFSAVLARAGTGAEAASAPPPAAIVVLGSGTPGAQAPPALAARLDAALARARASGQALVVVSGGIDFGETISEARVMGDYLRARGLAPDRIVQEERSTSTLENLLFSRDLLEKRGMGVARHRIEIVTSDFHTLRARWIARRAGYGEVRTVGAPTPLYLRYNAWLREYFAVAAGCASGEF